jgi:phospholipase/carboxylesterase
MLDAIQVETGAAVDASIIWLHGLGADGHDFESICDDLDLPSSLGIRYIFPHASVRPVTINGGMRMRAWYDIRNLDLSSELDLKGIEESAQEVTPLLEREVARGVAPDRIILAGFSQGGLIALHVGLRYPRRLGGILALSTYCPTVLDLNGPLHQIPIFWGHGDLDNVVPISAARATLADLHEKGLDTEFKTYPMEHSLCSQEVSDIARWISRRLERV